MATTTPQLILRKPAGADNVNVTTDISDNMDKIDAASQKTLAYVQVVANQTGVTGIVDLTGFSSGAVTVGTSRRVRVKAKVNVQQRTVKATNTYALREGASVLNEQIMTLTTDDWGHVFLEAILTPSAGAHTYKLTVTTGGGTVDTSASATRAGYIHVEDIGAA